MYAVPYQPDLQRALDELKEREFKAGRYYPAIDDICTSYVHPEHIVGPGAQHATIDAALEASQESGTQSVLDMVSVGPTPGLQTVVPLDDESLEALFGTTHPTRRRVEEEMDEWLEPIGRGEGIAIVVFTDDGVPYEILFAGYSFD
jgi:hypothetical protein